MRDYGKVQSSFWSSATIGALSEDGRTLAFYLLTSPHSTISGVFRLPDGYACEDLRWTSERVIEGFRELFDKGFANRCETTKWVYVYKHFDWNKPENPNQRKAAKKVALAIPDECAWKVEFMRVWREFLDISEAEFSNPCETVKQPFLNQKQKQEQEQEQKQDRTDMSTRTGTALAAVQASRPANLSVQVPDDIAQIFAYWQKRMDSPRSNLDDKRRKLIRNALKLGYTPAELCRAIRGCSLTPHNMGQNDRGQKFNGIDLIFRNADQIDRFIANDATPPPSSPARAGQPSQTDLDRINAEAYALTFGKPQGVIIDV